MQKRSILEKQNKTKQNKDKNILDIKSTPKGRSKVFMLKNFDRI